MKEINLQSKTSKIPARQYRKALGGPKLRFAEFSDEWEEKKLGKVGENIIGLTYSPSNVVFEGGTIVLRASNIKNGSLSLIDQVRVNVNIQEKLKIKR